MSHLTAAGCSSKEGAQCSHRIPQAAPIQAGGPEAAGAAIGGTKNISSQSRTSKGIGRQGMVLKHRNFSQKELIPYESLPQSDFFEGDRPPPARDLPSLRLRDRSGRSEPALRFPLFSYPCPSWSPFFLFAFLASFLLDSFSLSYSIAYPPPSFSQLRY